MGSTTETGAEGKGAKGKGCQGKRGDFFRALLLDDESYLFVGPVQKNLCIARKKSFKLPPSLRHRFVSFLSQPPIQFSGYYQRK